MNTHQQDTFTIGSRAEEHTMTHTPDHNDNDAMLHAVQKRQENEAAQDHLNRIWAKYGPTTIEPGDTVNVWGTDYLGTVVLVDHEAPNTVTMQMRHSGHIETYSIGNVVLISKS